MKEVPGCPNGCGPLRWVDDEWECPVCGCGAASETFEGSSAGPDEVAVVVDLKDRQWRLLEALREQKMLPYEIADAWGVSRQNINNTLRELRDLGVIRRRADLGHWETHTFDRYPYEVERGVDVRYAPAVPPGAVLRAAHATDSTFDLSVPPIRFVRWRPAGWSIQAVPVLRPDGAYNRSKTPEHRLVWAHRDDGRSWCFPARIDATWPESETVRVFEQYPAPKYRLRLSVNLRVQLTLAIAAVMAVEPAFDVSVTDAPHAARPPAIDGAGGE